MEVIVRSYTICRITETWSRFFWKPSEIRQWFIAVWSWIHSDLVNYPFLNTWNRKNRTTIHLPAKEYCCRRISIKWLQRLYPSNILQMMNYIYVNSDILPLIARKPIFALVRDSFTSYTEVKHSMKLCCRSRLENNFVSIEYILQNYDTFLHCIRRKRKWMSYY